MGDEAALSEGLTELADELWERVLCALLPWCLPCAEAAVEVPVVELSAPKAASSVSARLWTPKVLSRDLPIVSVLCEAAEDCSKSPSRFMKKAVGTLLDGRAGRSMLDFRDRGLTGGGRASPPGSGRMLEES